MAIMQHAIQQRYNLTRKFKLCSNTNESTNRNLTENYEYTQL